MGKIVKFEPSGFSLDKIGGYNKLPPIIIGKLFEAGRGNENDLYVIKHYSGKEAEEITRGYLQVKKIDNPKELRKRQLELAEMLDEYSKEAASYITSASKVFCKKEDYYNVLYVICKDGVMGCGWYDTVNTEKKGLMFAGQLMYGFGFINAGEDEKLLEATYHFLPYEVEMCEEIEDVDKVIIEGLKEAILKNKQ